MKNIFGGNIPDVVEFHKTVQSALEDITTDPDKTDTYESTMRYLFDEVGEYSKDMATAVKTYQYLEGVVQGHIQDMVCLCSDRGSRRISAVKLYYRIYNCSLAHARDAVDSILIDRGLRIPA